MLNKTADVDTLNNIEACYENCSNQIESHYCLIFKEIYAFFANDVEKIFTIDVDDFLL